MDIGVFIEPTTIDNVVSEVRELAGIGVRSVWLPQIFGLDTLTTLAVVAHEVPDVRLGTAVVPTYPRHPMMLAAQARTVQQAARGRLTLGIGLSHQIVIENMLGMDYGKPVRHLREYLDILLPLLRGEAAAATGETLTFNGSLEVESAPVPVVVAALGAQMLKLAGARTEGTITWMTGHETIRGHVAPSIRAAAADAGRPDPRVVMALPVCVTDDEAAAREACAKRFEIYGFLPSYRAMLDREGAAGPADVAVVGTADVVRSGIEAAFEAGATEFVVVPFSKRQATLDLVASLL